MQEILSQLELFNEVKWLESQLGQLLKTSEEAIISCDENHRIILFNQGAEKLFGYAPGEVLGKDMDMLLPERFRYSHRALFSDFAAQPAHAKLMTERDHLYALKKDGSECIVEASISNLVIDNKHILSAFMRDVTLKVRYREELKSAEEKLSAIIEIADDAIISLDRHFRIVIFNHGAQKIFGYTAEEAIGKSLDMLIPRSLRAIHEKHMDEFSSIPNNARRMADRHEILGLRKDGIEFHAEASISNILLHDELLFTVILRDVSFNKMNEKELRQRLTKLEELNTMNIQNFGVIAHDIKNPLWGLREYTTILRTELDELPREDMLTILGNMSKICFNLSDLLEDLLEWTRIRLNSLTIKPEPVLVSEVVQRSSTLFREAAALKHVSIKSLIPPDCMVLVDLRMLFTVFRNLLSNAIKFSGPHTEITITAIEREKEYQFCVSDQGIGIPEEMLEKLFRTDVDTVQVGTNLEKGNGLGLFLCKEFIEKNNGTISVESIVGSGTRIYFTLRKSIL
jgi:PAS domain S-box-containing protein